MCRSIRSLYHVDPPATDEEVRAAARQFVRKVTGSRSPARADEATFARAVDEVAATVGNLFRALDAEAPRRRGRV